MTDVQVASDFPRRSSAVEVGLHTALGFPIRHAGAVLGVIEFFDAQRRHPDGELLALMDALGSQIGLFLGRRQADATAAALLNSERTARAEADAAVRTRDEFLASASHDLRGPLTAIRGYAALARRRIELDRIEQVPAALESIEAAARRLTSALDELLDVAQLQAGRRLALRRSMTDLVALVRQVAADQEVAVQPSRILVSSELAELSGWWDAPRLERALSNLVGNAVKYTDKGGVLVGCRRRRGPNGVAIEVHDTGRGIPKEELPLVFEAFRRVDPASSDGGVGLGLAIVRRQAEALGHRITVRSAPGKGSCFAVEVTLAPDDASGTAALPDQG
jgi:signal transduction histidine kinase